MFRHDPGGGVDHQLGANTHLHYVKYITPLTDL
jgi:hypothetical protein